MSRLRLLIVVPFFCYFLAAYGWPIQALSASTNITLVQLRDTLSDAGSDSETLVNETSQITLRAIQIQGASILSNTELEASVSQYVGVAMSYEQMFEVAMVVESHYRQQNHLARVILPPQDLSKCVLILEVIESVVTVTEVEQILEELPNTRTHVEALLGSQQSQGEPQLPRATVNADVTVLLSLYQNRASNDETKADLSEGLSSFATDLSALLPGVSDESHHESIAFVSDERPLLKTFWGVETAAAEISDSDKGLILQKVSMWHEPLTRRRRFISVRAAS